ncbi:PREDICTED: histone H2A-Bbd type 2/3-like [Galeopterus variegatus]|uniref:Histone H2A n=1 Tax=Galeopterus variegatus TaxID=482537 RepID=A0ABM0PZM7_GALVR|nr:PREDICTED: histone H2A-Bbd type 2/3-like [Galeopterus variegatus]
MALLPEQHFLNRNMVAGQDPREGFPEYCRCRCPRADRAEQTFSVSHPERLLREGPYAHCLSSCAPVFLGAIIEYVTAKVLELVSDEARRSGRRGITLELLDVAVHNDVLLFGFFVTTTISQVASA